MKKQGFVTLVLCGCMLIGAGPDTASPAQHAAGDHAFQQSPPEEDAVIGISDMETAN
ncbi:MAG: hypothetical protein ACLUDF_01965 [Butyricicoccus sp.]